jgi:hypothetical protein
MFGLIGIKPQVEDYASAAGSLGGCYDDWTLDALVARKVSECSDA